jgi:quercetin dioxygenase-like cupin family protein
MVRTGLEVEQGRTARTLVKDGPLRVTLIVLGPGGKLREHSAPGPITVHALEGRLRFSTGGADHDLAAGDLLALGAEVAHSVASETGGAFLLTMTLPAPSAD